VPSILPDDVRYRLLKLLESNPELTQRDVARELGVSVGKVNYCLQALVAKGWVKVDNFSKSGNKSKYIYLLTPRGIEEKARVSVRFLKRKIAEYEALQAEIEQIRNEVGVKPEADNPSGQKWGENVR